MTWLPETVPKALYDAEVDRRRASEYRVELLTERINVLTDRISDMRAQGFSMKGDPRKPFVQVNEKQSDAEIVSEAEEVFIEKLALELVQEHGIPMPAAKKEAARIREEIGHLSMQPER